MKTRFLLALASLSLPLASHGALPDANERVRVEVRLDADKDQKDLKRTTVDKVVQHTTLQISLSGKSKEKEDRIIHWTAYGRDEKDNDVRVVKSGNIPLALNAKGLQSAASEVIATTYVPDHGVVRKPNRKGGGRAHEVEGTGTKFVGYRVEILDGKTVVGEAGEKPENLGKK
jgi:hypothetical protein